MEILGFDVVPLLIVFVFILFVVVDIADKYTKNENNKKFKDAISSSIIQNKVGLKELRIISDTHEMNHEKIYKTLKELYTDVLTKEPNKLSEKKEDIEKLIESYEKEEPFKNVPSDLIVHLERVKEKLKDDEILIEPLTNQILELLKIKNQEYKKLRFYTIGGFFIGILGLCYAIYVTNFSENINETHIKKESIEKKPE